MKKTLLSFALITSSFAFPKLDVIVNLQVDHNTMVRRLSSTEDSFHQVCQDPNLKVEVSARVVNAKIEMDFVISKRDVNGIYSVISRPHMIADPGIPAVVELKEQAPQERHPIIRGICSILQVEPKMVEKSTLKLIVTAQK